MRKGCKEPYNQSEAVKEWWWATHDILRCEQHLIADKPPVVDYVTGGKKIVNVFLLVICEDIRA